MKKESQDHMVDNDGSLVRFYGPSTDMVIGKNGNTVVASICMRCTGGCTFDFVILRV